jgi:hypothetical protein
LQKAATLGRKTLQKVKLSLIINRLHIVRLIRSSNPHTDIQQKRSTMKTAERLLYLELLISRCNRNHRHMSCRRSHMNRCRMSRHRSRRNLVGDSFPQVLRHALPTLCRRCEHLYLQAGD